MVLLTMNQDDKIGINGNKMWLNRSGNGHWNNTPSLYFFFFSIFHMFLNKKQNASKKALTYVKENMVIGLGSGTTSEEFIKLLGKKVKNGFKIRACVPTSLDARMNAIKHGLSPYLVDPDQITKIDIAIDGADFVSKEYVLKGGGAALTREKIVAYNAENFIVIVDDSKIIKSLKPTVAIECIKFSAPFVLRTLEKLGHDAVIRLGAKKVGPVISDNGNFIVDAKIEIKDPANLEAMLNSIPGVLENGIFTKFNKIIVGTETSAYEF